MTKFEFNRELTNRLGHVRIPSVDRIGHAISNLYEHIDVECLTLKNESHREAVCGIAAQALYELGAKLASELRC